MSAALERLAAACVLPGFPGLEPPDWVRRRVADGLGGVCLFAWNVRDQRQLGALTEALRGERPELLVAIDEEGGDVTRLEAAHGSSYPGNLALGAVDDTDLTEAVAAAIAAELAGAGVNLNLAPVADANTNARNPVIGVRAFGSDPALVARHVAAFVRGTQSCGVAACAKHFPGHGDTSADSHHELPTVEGELDLAPFRAAIEAGVCAVMPGHLRVPALDDAPATVSRTIVTGLLRGELGFGGLVISDALEMHAVSATLGLEETAVRAIAAGIDLLCLGHDLADEETGAVQRALAAAVRAGRLPEDRLAEAAARVEAVGRWTASTPCNSLLRGEDVGLAAARRAVRAEGVVALASAPLVVELVPEANLAAGVHAHGLADALPGAAAVRLHAWPAELPDDPRPLVVVLRDAARHPWQQAAAEALVARRPDAVVVETGLPGRPPRGAAGYVATFGAGAVNLRAAAELLRPS